MSSKAVGIGKICHRSRGDGCGGVPATGGAIRIVADSAFVCSCLHLNFGEDCIVSMQQSDEKTP